MKSGVVFKSGNQFAANWPFNCRRALEESVERVLIKIHIVFRICKCTKGMDRKNLNNLISQPMSAFHTPA